MGIRPWLGAGGLALGYSSPRNARWMLSFETVRLAQPSSLTAYPLRADQLLRRVYSAPAMRPAHLVERFTLPPAAAFDHARRLSQVCVSMHPVSGAQHCSAHSALSFLLFDALLGMVVDVSGRGLDEFLTPPPRNPRGSYAAGEFVMARVMGFCCVRRQLCWFTPTCLDTSTGRGC